MARNVFQQPFGVNSIWNTPIGSGGGGLVSGGIGPHGGQVYRYANSVGPVYEFAGRAVANTLNDENLILFGPSSPLKTVYTNPVNWSINPAAPARCAAIQTPTATSVPVPATASYPGLSGGDPCLDPGVNGTLPNCCAGILLADRVSLYQNQPMQICSVGGSPTTEFFFDTVSIFSDETSVPPSARGSHGGSVMSSLGGTIRYNEIIPGNCPIVPGVADVMRHALGAAFNFNLFNAFTTTFVWPATNSDNCNEGLLLALLPNFNISSLLTAPGRSLAWTIMNYGMYIKDGSGWDAINIETEYSYGDSSVNCPTGRATCQFQTLWGYTMNPSPNSGLPFGQDIATICNNLYVITNNSPTSIGGGGTPLQPLAATAVDPGVITVPPVVTNASFPLSSAGLYAGEFVGQVTASQSPFWWTLSGTGSPNFWIQPTTGLIYVSQAGVTGITPGTYTLTATARNIQNTGTGTVTIVVSAVSGTITMGETTILPTSDFGSANFLVAQAASLSQAGTLQSIAFYVTTAAGSLRLGIYAADGVSGRPGTKLAETAAFTPVVGWNTVNVILPVSLAVGNYWLAFLPSDNALAFRRSGSSGSAAYYSFTFGPMPATFSTIPTTAVDHWSLYANVLLP